MSAKKRISAIASFIILISTARLVADWKDDAKAVKISGGADHSLVLTEDKHPWGCGYNLYYQLGLGDQYNRYTPVRVHGFNNNGFLGDINDVSAGYMHSLALDVNSSVWAWGNNLGLFG
jgi:alpha-tubulin suppressor-like RCC1 family protein